MSDKIYACLLRLYPARFRQHYGAEALQLFHDRLHEEQGSLRKLRVQFELLIDLALALPQAYRNTYPTAATTPALQPAAGLPAFRTLEEEPLRPGSVFIGSIFAIAALALFIFLMNHAAAYHPFSNSIARLSAAPTGSQSNPDVETVAEKIERQMRNASQLDKCSFEKLEQHPGNIGYVKLSWFPDPASCGEIAEGVMQRLNDTDAIIIDLRNCRGGYPEMVRWMASWLFDRPVPWYNPRATSPSQLVTNSPVPGSRLAHKPVFILTSSRTFSGAEHFAYNLKTLKRAILVGETTSGASHAEAGTPPTSIALSEPKPIWEGVGVPSDVRVDSADALRTAERLALTAIHKK